MSLCKIASRFAGSALSIFVLTAQAAWAGSYVTPANWDNYLSSQGQPANWADMVRGLASAGTGVPPDTATANSALSTHQQQGGSTLDLIAPIGWVDSGKDAAAVASLIQSFDAYGSASAEQTLASQIVTLQSQYKGGALYWQIGNEINSSVMTQNLLAAKGITVSSNDADDPQSIPIYAEYIFAPSVEAIRQASTQLYGSKNKINVMLGTIGNARETTAQSWLNQLMNYRIQGTFAHSLAGTRVAGLITIVALQYTTTSDDIGSGNH